MKRTVSFSPPQISEEDIIAVVNVLRSGWITSGSVGEEFSLQLSQYNQSFSTKLTNSATAALFVALKAMGIGQGDEVITTPYTFAATANVILHTGATLVFADVAKNSFYLDPEEVYKKITKNTKAIIPVDFSTAQNYHWDLNRLGQLFIPTNKFQEKLGRPLLLVDAAHALGSRKIDSQSDMAAYSFHAVKNLTTAEGGALSVRSFEDDKLDKEFDQRLNQLILHGQNRSARDKFLNNQWEYDITCPGYKFNMTDISAALGLSQLQRYESTILPKRRELFNNYISLLSDHHSFILEEPAIFNNVQNSSCHLLPLRVKNFSENQRNKLIEFCMGEGVSVNVHYKPLPLMSCQEYHTGIFPNAYSQYQNEISLPLHTGLSNNDIEYVVQVLKKGIKECE